VLALIHANQENFMSIADIKKNTEQRMIKSIETLKANLAKVRTGRAHPGILDSVMVDYYGSPTQLSQVANVTLIDARTIGVQPWEKKMLNAIEKAIRDSDLGLNPSSQGELIRVPTPPLTEERRKEMVKLVKNEGEDSKIAIRNVRRDANESVKKLVKDKEASEDDERRSQDEIQKMTDKFVAEVDKLLAEKEKEVLTV
jgi:ribosome recycling factor